MEERKGINRRKLWIIIGAALLLLVGLMAALVIHNNKKGYRVIQIYELNGAATIERDGVGTFDAYENLTLLNKDMVSVAKESCLRLKLDEDKYMLAEAESIFSIYAVGSSENSKTDIDLKRGALTVEIQNKLSNGSSYQITTPNSVMAVRGTVFYVEAGWDEADYPYTRVALFEGSVEIQKKNEDESLSEPQVLKSGQEALIYREKDEVIIEILDKIDDTQLSKTVLLTLRDISLGGRALCWTTEEIALMLDAAQEREEEVDKAEDSASDVTAEEMYTVTFLYQGNVFGTQQVVKGAAAGVPKLRPAEEGSWDFDFTTPIEADTDIEFK